MVGRPEGRSETGALRYPERVNRGDGETENRGKGETVTWLRSETENRGEGGRWRKAKGLFETAGIKKYK
jgi:hypothetical protein